MNEKGCKIKVLPKLVGDYPLNIKLNTTLRITKLVAKTD